MSISVSVGFMIPANVVEVGNEITSDQLAAITSATTPTSANPFLTTSDAASFLPLAGGNMTGGIVFDTTGLQNINKGTFDSSRGGYNGISLTCAVGYELNWQAGYLTCSTNSGTTFNSIMIDNTTGTDFKVWDTVNNLGVTIAHDSIAIQHIDTPNQTSYFTNEYIGFEDISGTPHSAYIEHDVITVQDATDTTEMRSNGITLSTGGSITFGDSTVQTTAAVTGVTNDKAIANAFASSMWYTDSAGTFTRNGSTNNDYISGSLLSAGITDGTTTDTGFFTTGTNSGGFVNGLDVSTYWYVTINGTVSDINVYSP